MDFRLELVALPVEDVDRARAFYEQVGFHVDFDDKPAPGVRFVQVTPPGSACSVAFGTGLEINGRPFAGTGGAVVQVVVDDADAAYEHLVAAGVDAPPVEDLPWGRFTGFTDPDGNRWTVQEVPQRG